MKHPKYVLTTVFAALILACGNAFAETDYCKQVHGLAKIIMEARQAGVALPEMIKIAMSNENSEAMRSLNKTLTLAAYEEPQYSTEKMKAKTVTKFANTISLECYKNE